MKAAGCSEARFLPAVQKVYLRSRKGVMPGVMREASPPSQALTNSAFYPRPRPFH